MTTTQKSFETAAVTTGPHQQLTITLPETASTQVQGALFTEGIQTVVQFLVESVDRQHQGSVVLDVRTTDPMPKALAPTHLAYVEAVRGLIQAHTLEQGPAAPPTNLVVSSHDQDEARKRTLQYLQSEGGSFSRGATYDLREGS